MSKVFQHELLYRGQETLAKLAALRLTVCGVGAIGSHLCDNLARQGLRRLRIIDRDQIEAHNVGTQIYGESEVGLPKVEALRNRLFRACGIEIEAVAKELTGRNARTLLKDCDLIVDAFDNSAARHHVQNACREWNVPCLHVGLAADYAEIIWDDQYRVPDDGNADACDYPLARNVVLMAAAIASESILLFANGNARRNWSVTLRDIMVASMEC